MPVEDYITTNYDYCLEAALKANGYDNPTESEKEKYKLIPYIKESTYSLHRCHAFIKKYGVEDKIKKFGIFTAKLRILQVSCWATIIMEVH